MSELIRVKVTMVAEIVVENYYGEDAQKAAEEAFRGNRNDIVAQAAEAGDIKVEALMPITHSDELPKGWTRKCLPWLPNVQFGDKKQEKRIEEFLTGHVVKGE